MEIHGKTVLILGRARVSGCCYPWEMSSSVCVSYGVSFAQHDDVINGNIFRVTGHLCGEFTGHRWIPRTKASDAELWCFLWSAPIGLSWLSLNFADGSKHWFKVNTWCRQATNNYLCQCWSWSASPYVVTEPQWVKISFRSFFITGRRLCILTGARLSCILNDMISWHQSWF